MCNIRALLGDPVAVMVKKADLRHNMDLSRLGHEPTQQDLSRQQRCQKALNILEKGATCKND